MAVAIMEAVVVAIKEVDITEVDITEEADIKEAMVVNSGVAVVVGATPTPAAAPIATVMAQVAAAMPMPRHQPTPIRAVGKAPTTLGHHSITQTANSFFFFVFC